MALAIAPEVLNGVYGGSKPFVLALSRSLQHELADKGVRIQAVLPDATATEFWGTAGVPLGNVPAAILMSAGDCGLTFDADLLYTGAMFHNVGLMPGHSSAHERFKVDGANAAKALSA